MAVLVELLWRSCCFLYMGPQDHSDKCLINWLLKCPFSPDPNTKGCLDEKSPLYVIATSSFTQPIATGHTRPSLSFSPSLLVLVDLFSWSIPTESRRGLIAALGTVAGLRWWKCEATGRDKGRGPVMVEGVEQRKHRNERQEFKKMKRESWMQQKS